MSAIRESGQDLLGVSLSGCDPKPTLSQPGMLGKFIR
jgi:hypothetical protein